MATRNPFRELKEGKTGQLWEGLYNDEFNSKGELNAYDKKDAGFRIANILERASREKKSVIGRPNISEDARRRILTAATADPDKGMRVIAQVQGEVVRKIVDYAGWARKVFDVQPIAQGEVFRIPKDIDVLGWVVAGDGQTIVSQLRSRYVFPGEWKNVAFIEVDILDIMQANWDIFERGIDRAAQQIMRGEDVQAVRLLQRAARTVNDTVIYSTLSVSAFEDVRYQVERWRLTVDKFVISRHELSDLVKTTTPYIDFVTQRELILAGYVGTILNAQIITSAGIGVEEVVPPGVFFAVTEGRYLGRLGERLALQGDSYNALVRGELKKGTAQFEIIGIGVANSRAVAMGTK